MKVKVTEAPGNVRGKGISGCVRGVGERNPHEGRADQEEVRQGKRLTIEYVVTLSEMSGLIL